MFFKLARIQQVHYTPREDLRQQAPAKMYIICIIRSVIKKNHALP